MSEPRQGTASRRRTGRLSRSAEFDRVYRRGRSVSNRYLVVYTFPRGEPGSEPRIGLSVGRKVGGAVDRNRVKRLLREACDRHAALLPTDCDVVVAARPDALELASAEGAGGIASALAELLAAPSAAPVDVAA